MPPAMRWGVFFYVGGSPEWKANLQAITLQNSFAIENARPTGGLTFDINIFEVRAVRMSIEYWGRQWGHQALYVYTDNKTTFYGLQKGYIDGGANEDLRTLLCVAASFDIRILPAWIKGTDNELADALSRFDLEAIANWCPCWQISTTDYSIFPLLPQSGLES
jgi:hypothetical protein